jgi:7,8-dihydropterin-6-yl-methyl-4-(beta-D-ribofuranosyl)aminobenzene 5'-phosphate synthase
LKPFDVGYFIAGHCTGWRALHAMADAYGERVSQSAVGTRYQFAAETPPDQRTTPPQASFTPKPSW